MRTTPILLAIFVLTAWRVSAMDLQMAIVENKVAVEVSGSQWDSIPPALRSGFYPKMQMTVSNLTNKPLDLDLEPGYMLEAKEPGYQAMLLTQSIDIKLKPNERKRDYLYAMCTELTKSGPNSSLHYEVTSRARPALLQMALFITSHKYLVHAAQEAVWSISDDMPIPSIMDSNHSIQEDLQQQAANIKKVNLKALQEEYDKRKGAQLLEFNGSKVDRNIPFTVKDSAMVSVAYYDGNGKVLRPIVKPVLLRQGKHSVRYEPFPLAFAGQRYTVRLIKDGNVYKEYNFRQ